MRVTVRWQPRRRLWLVKIGQAAVIRYPTKRPAVAKGRALVRMIQAAGERARLEVRDRGRVRV